MSAFFFVVAGRVNNNNNNNNNNNIVFCFAVWFIGSEAGGNDVLPPVRINLLAYDVATATVDRGVVFQGERILANVSEVVALAASREEDAADSQLFFEPGRLLYHSIEFCNFVHRCTIAAGTPSIVIRTCVCVHVWICS